MPPRPPLYGLLAEFNDAEALVEATRAAYAAGYRRMDAYSPYPIEELSEALGFHENRIPLVVLLGGLAGAVGGYGLQFYLNVIDYPLNVGERPLHSWPSFIPVTFETTILGAALAAILGMLALNGLPMPYHPVFNVQRFLEASRDAFFLAIEAGDPRFDRQATRAFLRSLPGARDVVDVAE
jgi:hypothetical protein